MISSNPLKLFAAVLFVFTFTGSCSFWSNPADVPAGTDSSGQIKSRVPFETKEPAVFQAEIVVSAYTDGVPSEKRIMTARNGIRVRNDYPDGVSFLQVSESERLLLDSDDKIYAAMPAAATGGRGDELGDLLTTQWLNESRDAEFEKLDTENGLTTYRVALDASIGSEILVYFDENLKIPVKQEFYRVSGDQKALVYSMEIKNPKLETDDRRFELPADYRSVSLEQFQRLTRDRKESVL